MKYKLYHHLLFVLLLSSCYKYTNKNQIPSVEFSNIIDLKDNIYRKEIVANIPSEVELIDSALFLFRPGGVVVKIINANNGADFGYFGSFGNGPGEFHSPHPTGYDKSDSSHYISDITSKKLTINKVSTNNDTIQFKLIKELHYPKSEISFGFMHRLENGFFIANTSSGSKKLLILLDKDLNIVHQFCDYPLNIEVDNPFRLYGHIASFGNKFVFAVLNIGYIVCYGISQKNEIKKEWEYLLSKPYYKTTPKFKWDYNLNADGFYDVKMTQNYVVCLYSGKIFNIDRTTLPETILVFNHNGTPKVKIKLNSKCGRFAISEDNRFIYASCFDGSYEIIKYDTGNILNKIFYK